MIFHQIRTLVYGRSLARKLTNVLSYADIDVKKELLWEMRKLTPTRQGVMYLEELMEKHLHKKSRYWDDAISQLMHQLKLILKYEPENTIRTIDDAIGIFLPIERANRHPAEILKSILIQGFTIKQWMTRLYEDHINQVKNMVRLGFTSGEDHVRILDKALSSSYLFPKMDALVTGAVVTTTDGAREKLFLRYPSLFPREIYHAILDSHTTAECRRLNGRVFDRGTGPHPPIHWGCRSFRLPYFVQNNEILKEYPLSQERTNDILKRYSRHFNFAYPKDGVDGLPEELRDQFKAYLQAYGKKDRVGGKPQPKKDYVKFLNELRQDPELLKEWWKLGLSAQDRTFKLPSNKIIKLSDLYYRLKLNLGD